MFERHRVQPRSQRLTRAFVRLVSSVALALAGCDDGCGDPQPSPPAATSAALAEPTAPATPAEEAPQPAPAADEKPPYPAPGWSLVTLVDQVPVCVFPSYDEQARARQLDEARPTKLRAGSTVVVGAYGPWCVHESCDQRPSLQCNVEREGDVLVVHTKYWGAHKDGSSCTEDCKPINAGCQTPELARGKYTLRHGDRTLEFKVPGKVASPCLGELRQPDG